MAIQVTINGVTGTSPYDVYVCQFDGTGCFYINTITDSQIPYTFDIPSPYDNSNEYQLKVVDNSNCVLTGTSQLFATPTPTPTNTPTKTPTPTPTSTGIVLTPSTTPTNTNTPTTTPTPTSTGIV